MLINITKKATNKTGQIQFLYLSNQNKQRKTKRKNKQLKKTNYSADVTNE